MKSLDKNLVEAGITGKPHGINGEINAVFDYGAPVLPDKYDPDDVADGIFAIIDIDSCNVPFLIKSIRSKGRDGAIVGLKGLESEKDAALLTNKTIKLTKDDFARLYPHIDCAEDDTDDDTDDRIYLEDLIGFETHIHTDGTARLIGVIDDIDQTTDNTLFVISEPQSGKEILIPAVDDFITDIDTTTRKISLDIPPGLLDLNDA